MKIEWNKVTWYSKLLAVILFVGVFILAFNLGRRYEKLESVFSFPAEAVLYTGKTKSLGDLKITLNAVTQDYRCPVDVECIQAGAIVANVTFDDGSKTVTKNMPSDEVPQEFSKYKLSIVDVYPPAKAGKEIPSRDYRVTFHVDLIK